MKLEKCKRGHDRTPENVSDNGTCKICMRENSKRIAEEKRKHKTPKTHCKRGHERVPGNTLKNGACKTCAHMTSRKWYIEHSERSKEIDIKSRKKNREKRIERAKKWNRENRERVNLNNRRWCKNNSHIINAFSKKYKISKIHRTPKWLTKEHIIEIKLIYELSKLISNHVGIPHHVDHIVPLRGKNVSGLHVPWNLRVIPAKENMKKHNIWSS